MIKRTFCGFVAIACSVACPTAAAQQPDARAQVLVLGTYHFANPGLDVVKTNVADVFVALFQRALMKTATSLNH